MANNETDRFEILRLLAIAGSSGRDLSKASQAALEMAAQYVGLTAVALYLWDDKYEVTVTLSHAESEANRKRLSELEDGLFLELRKEQRLLAAYMSFGGEKPCHSFTLPLRHGDKVFGAVIGLQEGDRTIVSEDRFLEAFCALIAISYAAQGSGPGAAVAKELLDKERLSAIVETAVTVNHEVNNPLTAILGNVQLLLLKDENLSDELKAKLKTIEESAMKIKDVTQRLMRITSPRTVDYNEDTKMIDISDDDTESQ